MKVNYLSPGEFSTEGLTIISKKIKEFMQKNKIEFVNNGEDFRHIHSHGFFSSIKNEKIKKIYSLYSYINEKGYKTFFNTLESNLKLGQEYPKGHSRIKDMFLPSLSSLIPLKLKKHYLKNMNILVVPTLHMKNELNLSNIRVIPFGIDEKRFKNLKIKRNTLRVSYFGHNDSLKGVYDVIKAFGKIKSNVELHIYLSEFSKKTEKLAKKHNKKIRVFGKVENIEKTYNESDIIVIPYRTKAGATGIPLVLLETMACERAVITTNLENLKEVAQDSVEYVKPNSPNQIKNKIVDLLNNKEKRINLGKKARERILEEYTEKKMFNRYLKLYNSMV